MRAANADQGLSGDQAKLSSQMENGRFLFMLAFHLDVLDSLKEISLLVQKPDFTVLEYGSFIEKQMAKLLSLRGTDGKNLKKMRTLVVAGDNGRMYLRMKEDALPAHDVELESLDGWLTGYETDGFSNLRDKTANELVHHLKLRFPESLDHLKYLSKLNPAK